MSEEIHHIDVETFCSKKERMVTLTLASMKPFKGEVVKGKPIMCNVIKTCSQGDECLLKKISIETRRR